MNTEDYEMEEQKKQDKKMYQRWWVWVLGIIFLLIVWVFGGRAIDEARTKQIPNVMSINYTDAVKVLEEKGFKVTSIETDAGSILSNDSLYNRSVNKGEVFKVNDSIYPEYSSETKDKNITIYYAKDDYTYVKPEKEPAKGNTVSGTNDNTAKTSNTASSGSSDWKQFLKDYEAWVDSYVEIIKKYKNNPSDAKLISEYGKFMGETAEWAEKSKKYEDKLQEMSAEDFSEYMQTITRILEKINAAAQ